MDIAALARALLGRMKNNTSGNVQAESNVPIPEPTMTDKERSQKRLAYIKRGYTFTKMTPEEIAAMPKKKEPTPPPDKGAMDYYKTINKEAKSNNIPQDILYNLLARESMHFNPDVISGNLSSPVGAQGIAQFMPETARGMGFDPLDPQTAIKKAAEYLADKKKRHGTWENALAAYNAGSGAVEKYGGVPPYPETINYIDAILKNSKIK